MHFSTAFVAALAATANMVMAIPVASAESGLVLRVPHADFSKFYFILLTRRETYCDYRAGTPTRWSTGLYQ
jgi:hypothetical protein